VEAAAQASRAASSARLNLVRCAYGERATIFGDEEDRMPPIAMLLLACFLAIATGGATSGCSSSTTTTTRTTEQPSSEGGTTVQTTETKTTESQTSGPGLGILSGTIHAIGFILALPFKLVGGLIQLIF
jgi:hypothetical protein